MKITGCNWKRFQHYRTRRPPWIKLHTSLLDNRQWHTLSSSANKILVECWLLASESTDGTIGGDIEDIAFRLHTSSQDLWPVLQELSEARFVELSTVDASATLAERYPSAPESGPETETETKTETKTKKKTYTSEFEQVWRMHRRGPKARAAEEYQRAIGGDEINHVDLTRALDAYTRTFSDTFKGAHLWRWIRDRRWEETPDVPGALKRSVVLGPANIAVI